MWGRPKILLVTTVEGYCEFAECKAVTHIGFAFNGYASYSGSGDFDYCLSDEVGENTLIQVKVTLPKIVGEVHLYSDDSNFYKAQFKIWNEQTQTWSYFETTCWGETYDLIYNNIDYGDAVVYHYPGEMHIYFVWDTDKLYELSANDYLTASRKSAWECSGVGVFHKLALPKHCDKTYGSVDDPDLSKLLLLRADSCNSYCNCGVGSENKYVENIPDIREGTIIYQASAAGELETCKDIEGNFIHAFNITTSVPFKWIGYNSENVLKSGTAKSDLFITKSELAFIRFYDSFDFQAINESCMTQGGGFRTATLKVKGNGGIWINNYKIVINGEDEKVVDGYTADISAYVDQNVTIDVYPLFDERLKETHNVSVVEGLNELQLSNYYYSIQLRAYYKDPLGNLKPVGFSWLIQGVMKPDKVNYAGNFSMGGTGFSNFTVLVPAGEYNITFGANVLGFNKEDTQTLTLLDDAYYRYVTFIASLTSTEIEQGASSSAILQVILKDQYGNDVNNATIKVYDGNNTLIANQFTHDGQAIVGGLEIGSSYKIEVWVGQTKKAEKSITITEASQTVIITINLNEQEEKYLSGGGDTAFGGGTGGAITGGDTHTVAQNIVLSIFSSYGFWGLVILISVTVLAAANGGERIGLLTFVAGLGVLTFVIPLLPQVIFVVVAVVAFILFGWQAVGKIAEGRS